MTEQADGFLGRWARRKSQARSGATLPPEPEPASPAPLVSPAVPAPAGRLPGLATPATSGLAADLATPPGSAGPAGQAEPAEPAPPPPPPTLREARQLTPASDFRPFVARAVAPEVRNAAFKQLFTDPHFNVMDGLDIYIDDYSKSDPLPLAVARELLAAHFPPAPVVTDSAAATAPNAATVPESRPASGPVVQALAPSATPASAAPVNAALWPGPEDPATAQQPSDPAP
jgi:hypothetical protein